MSFSRQHSPIDDGRNDVYVWATGSVDEAGPRVSQYILQINPYRLDLDGVTLPPPVPGYTPGDDDLPFLPESDLGKAVWARVRTVELILEQCDYMESPMPMAGGAFIFKVVDGNAASAALECADKLLELRMLGYHVPVRVIEALRREAAWQAENRS